MALLLPKETRFGVTASYWKIEDIFLDFLMMKVTVHIVLFLDEDSRRGGSDPIENESFSIDLKDCPDVSFAGSSLEMARFAYEVVKQQPRWSGATDVMEAGQVETP